MRTGFLSPQPWMGDLRTLLNIDGKMAFIIFFFSSVQVSEQFGLEALSTLIFPRLRFIFLWLKDKPKITATQQLSSFKPMLAHSINKFTCQCGYPERKWRKELLKRWQQGGQMPWDSKYVSF